MPWIRWVLMVLFAVAWGAVAASEPTVEELNQLLSDEDTSKVADAAEAL